MNIDGGHLNDEGNKIYGEITANEMIKILKDLRCRNFRPTQPMLEAWRNYCSALLKKPEFVNAFKLAQTLMMLEDI